MIQIPQLKIFKNILDTVHRDDRGNVFKIDKITIESDLISAWVDNENKWYFLTKNLDWTDDRNHVHIFKISTWVCDR